MNSSILEQESCSTWQGLDRRAISKQGLFCRGSRGFYLVSFSIISRAACDPYSVGTLLSSHTGNLSGFCLVPPLLLNLGVSRCLHGPLLILNSTSMQAFQGFSSARNCAGENQGHFWISADRAWEEGTAVHRYRRMVARILGQDTVVPWTHGQELFETCTRRKRLVVH